MSFSNVMWIFDKPGGRRTVTKIEWTPGRPLSLQHTLFKKHSGVWCTIQYDSKLYWDFGEEKIGNSLQVLQDVAEQTKGENPIILTYEGPDEPVKSKPRPVVRHIEPPYVHPWLDRPRPPTPPSPREGDLSALLVALRGLFAEEEGHVPHEMLARLRQI